MKGKIKKLSVLVSLPVIALFIMAVMVSAGPREKFIHAKYAFTGSRGCLLATGGFDASLNALGTTWLGPNVWAGVYTFEKDGTGTVTAENLSISFGTASASKMK